MTDQPVVVIIGVSGSGKSTVAKALTEEVGGVFLEGDDFHPKANREKMERGEPLNDNDRSGWLQDLAQEIREKKGEQPVVLSCSALKRSYREVLRAGAPDLVTFVLLHGPRELLMGRMSGRDDHFMPVELLDSQLETLELPKDDEPVLTLSIEDEVAQLVAKIRAAGVV